MKFNFAVYRIGAALNVVSVMTLIFMMLLTSINVLLRALLRRPILGTYELVCLGAFVIILFAIPNTESRDGHIRVRFLVLRLAAGTQRVMEIIGKILGGLICFALSYQSFIYAGELLRANQVTATLQLPVYPFIYGMSLSFGLMGLILIIKAYELIFQGLKK